MRDNSIQPEFPSEEALQAYGALSFLYFRSPRHSEWSVANLRLIVQPPIDLRQASLFYHEGMPRAACTWAHLDENAQRAFLNGEPLAPSQWRSGKNLWLMEIIAPYGQGSGARVFRAFLRNVPAKIDRVRYLRVDDRSRTSRIMEISRRGGPAWGTPKAIDLKGASHGN